MRTITVAILALALAGCGAEQAHDAQEHAQAQEVYTCPMHPQVERDSPGSCPICGMDLVLRDHADHEPGEVFVSRGVQQSMNLRTATVDRGRLWRRIDTVGRVGFDESRLHHLHPRVEGWIERVYIDAVGDPVEAGQVLFTLYSPELVNAQEELVHALNRGDSGAARAAREKLRALDVQPDVVAELERTREIRRTLPWHAAHDAVVTSLGIRHGMFVRPGEVMLELADLSGVWVHADVFDRHASWLEVGQPAEVALSYDPGRTLDTVVSYVYPELDAETRAVRARLALDNPDGDLKPGMWTSVRIFAGPLDDVVMVPREALIRTGHATRVVLREDGEHFRVREVTPGIESGDWVEIREGLVAGEEIVVSGQFLIDSEAALRAGHGRLEGAGHQH